MIALLLAILLLMSPLPIVPTVDPIEVVPQASQTGTNTALTTAEEIKEVATKYQEKAKSFSTDLTSYNKNLKSPNEDVLAVSQDYGNSQSQLSSDFDIKNQQSIMKALEKLFLFYPCTEQRCMEVYDSNRYQFYENNVVEIYALTNTIDKLIDERIEPLLDEINVQAVSDKDENENIRNNLMVRQAVVQILTVIHELSAAELQLDMAKKIKEFKPVYSGEEIFKQSSNYTDEKVHIASITQNEEVSFAFAELSRRDGFKQFDVKGNIIEEKDPFEEERIQKEEKKYNKTLDDLREYKKEKIKIDSEKDLEIKYKKLEPAKKENVSLKKAKAKKEKSYPVVEEKQLIDFGKNSIFGYPKKPNNQHSISLIKDQLIDLADIKPLRKDLVHLTMVQNKLNEIYAYPSRLDRYRETRLRHESILGALTKSESAIISYFNRYTGGAGQTVWLGNKTPSEPNDYQGRGGVAAKAMALFDAQKAIMADENPENSLDVPEMTQDDIDEFNESGGLEGKKSISSEEELKNFKKENTDSLEDEDLKVMQEDNRKAQLIAWNTGRFLMQDIFNKSESYNISSISKLPIWNDNKNFYDAYIGGKVDAIKKYILSLPINPLEQQVLTAIVDSQKAEYDKLSDDKYYPENHQMVVDVFDNLLSKITGDTTGKINKEKEKQEKLKSDAEKAVEAKEKEKQDLIDAGENTEEKLKEIDDAIKAIKDKRDEDVTASENEQKSLESQLGYFNNTQEIPDNDYIVSKNGALSDFNPPAKQPKVELNPRQIIYFDDVDFNNVAKKDENDVFKDMTVDDFLNYKYGDIDKPSDGTDTYLPEVWYYMLKLKRGDYNFGDFSKLVNMGDKNGLGVFTGGGKPQAYLETIHMIANAEDGKAEGNSNIENSCNTKYKYALNGGENSFSELGLFISNHTIKEWTNIFSGDSDDPEECDEKCVMNNFRYAFSRNEIGDFLNIRAAEIGANAAVKKANADIEDINSDFVDLLNLAGYNAPKNFDVMRDYDVNFETGKSVYPDLELTRTKLTEYRDRLLSEIQSSYSATASKSSGNQMLKERLEPIAAVIKMIKLDKNAYLSANESVAKASDIEEKIGVALADNELQEKYNDEANKSFKNDYITVFCPVY